MWGETLQWWPSFRFKSYYSHDVNVELIENSAIKWYIILLKPPYCCRLWEACFTSTSSWYVCVSQCIWMRAISHSANALWFWLCFTQPYQVCTTHPPNPPPPRNTDLHWSAITLGNTNINWPAITSHATCLPVPDTIKISEEGQFFCLCYALKTCGFKIKRWI